MGKKRASRVSSRRAISRRQRQLPVFPPQVERHVAFAPVKTALPHRGLRLLYSYTVIMAALYVFYIFVALYDPGILLLKSYASLLIDVVLLVLLFCVVYGFRKRKYWAWKLALFWYSAGIIYSILIVYLFRKGAYLLSNELFRVSSLFILVINGLIIWYIFHKRDYFIDHTHEERFGFKDRFFVYSLVSFMAMVLTIGLTAGIWFYYSTTVLAGSLVHEMRDIAADQDWETGHQHCAAKTGAAKDVCYVVLATVSHGRAQYCQYVESPVYRFSCRQGLRFGV